jgi:putative hydrolase of the HAD superfamily
MTKPPRAVFFDFGGTLGMLTPVLNDPWRAWSQVARQFQLDVSDSQIQEANEEADRKFGHLIYAYHGRTAEYWRLRDTWVIDRLGVVARGPEFFDALQAIFTDSSRVQLYPEALEVLQELRPAGFHLGVISNFTDGLLPILKYHELDPMFDSVTYSQEVGAEKPDPRVFFRALERAHCKPEEAMHVGDSWESDYLGAVGVGIDAVWLNRRQNPSPIPCQEIADLRGLLPLLNGTR